MIEVIAEILRGPVFLAGETLHCQITFINKLTNDTDSTNHNGSFEKISWASVQLHCQRYVNEQKVNLQQQSQISNAKSNDSVATNVDIVPLDSTALIATKGETGQTVYTSKPCVLFCDLKLQPGETRTFSYSETISTHVPPTFRGNYVKYSYKLTIGTQRVNCPTTLIRVPFRVLVIPDLDKYIRQEKAAIALSQPGNKGDNPFVCPSRTEVDSLTTALDALQILTSRTHQNVFNISNSRGRVCRLTLFKNNFKIGEDILGLIDFNHTEIPCVQFTVTLQSEEILNPTYRRKSSQLSNILSFTKQSEFCLSTSQTHLSLSIPLSCTPSFTMDLVSLRWKLHFEFVTSKTPRSSLPTNHDPSINTIWSTPNSIEVESMTWDLPIKTLPTNPYYANNVAKVSCITMHSFLFVGHHKSQPTQDYSRTSTINNRDDFIKRTEQDREKRELNRKQLYAAIKIQSFYRRILAQKKLTQLAHERISKLILQLQSTSFNEENLIHLASLIKFGFKPNTDANLMMSLIESCWKHRQAIIEKLSTDNPALKVAIAKLLKYTVRCLSYFESIRLPTRFIEWFTDVKSYTNEQSFPSQNVQILTSYFLRNIIRNGYYTQMCSVIQSKVPLNVSKTSRIPAIEPIVDLLARPIESQLSDSTVRDEALITLRNELFSRSDLPALPLIITPTLIHRRNFPTIRYIELIDFHSTFPLDSLLYQNWKLYQLHAFLLIIDSRIDELPSSLTKKIVAIIRYFINGLITTTNYNNLPIHDNDGEGQDKDEQMDAQNGGRDEPDSELIEDCLSILNKRSVTNYLFKLANQQNRNLTEDDNEYIANLAVIAHSLIFYQQESILRSKFLMSLSTSTLFLRHLWFVSRTLKYETDYREHVLLLSQISCASSLLKDVDIDRIEPLLVTFCSLYSISLVPLHDDEFFRGPPATAFRTSEISDMVKILRDVCMGIVRYMYPDKQTSNPTNHVIQNTNGDEESIGKVSRVHKQVDVVKQRASKFSMVFKIIVQLLQQLRSRDVRRQFCPPEWWLTNQFQLHLDKTYIVAFARGLSEPLLLSSESYFNRDRAPDAFQFSVTELRLLTILQQIPFVIPFDARVQVLNVLIQQNKSEQQQGAEFFQSGSAINVRIRRDYIYEDAFEKLSPQNEPNLRRKLRVSFINAVGLDEAGVDGGGLFREFMNELLKSSFNPIRGLFKLTSDGYLYPNPNIAFIDENFGPHYYFLGRMLGKAIYEKFLAELPFATFFLQKILSRSSGKVDIHHLASLDPEMYKNLLYLKNYDGNVEDLGLDFTIVNSEIGQTQVIELKANGRNIAVTDENRIEYIHLVANYKLNKQINEQVLKFRQGLGDVINLEWLRMFDANELRILISGAPGEIDVSDWRNHSQYRAPYHKEHPVIQAFWRCVHEFTDDQKRKLLKFTTSCSRPPLFGFKELYPEFCIQSAGSEIDRLPTSNTCINLLKLPEYEDENVLKEKLLYAIQAAAGFEYS